MERDSDPYVAISRTGEMSMFYPWTVEFAVVPSVTRIPGGVDTVQGGAVVVPPHNGLHALDLVVVAAVGYLALRVVAAVASDAADIPTLPAAPEALAPTWPRLAATVALALEELVFPPPLVTMTHGPPHVSYSARSTFVRVYAEALRLLEVAGLAVETATFPLPFALAFVPALAVTYVGVALAFESGGRLAVRIHHDALAVFRRET
jgi:hypothetical protein